LALTEDSPNIKLYTSKRFQKFYQPQIFTKVRSRNAKNGCKAMSKIWHEPFFVDNYFNKTRVY